MNLRLVFAAISRRVPLRLPRELVHVWSNGVELFLGMGIGSFWACAGVSLEYVVDRDLQHCLRDVQQLVDGDGDQVSTERMLQATESVSIGVIRHPPEALPFKPSGFF